LIHGGFHLRAGSMLPAGMPSLALISAAAVLPGACEDRRSSRDLPGVRIAAPGGAFGAATAVGADYGAFDLAIAPGRAALMWTQGGATVSGEPVT